MKKTNSGVIIESNKMKRACIYLRTSSDKQIDNTSLPTQEKVARTACNLEGFKVADVQRREAVSAKDSNQARIQELLDFCKTNKGKFDVLMVYKLDRFARKKEHHFWLRSQLLELGIILRSATERIDETPAGGLIEGVLAAVNEYDNDVRRERVKLAMWRRVEEGLWPWQVPEGYKRKRIEGVRLSVPELDDTCCWSIKHIFELYSTGIYSLESLAKEVNKTKVKNYKGLSLHLYRQRIYKILNNVFYTGYLKNEKGDLVKAKHEALIDFSLFNKCQDVMSGKTRNTNVKRSRHNPDFPLRSFVLCGFCSQPLTGCWSTGNGGRYANYYCFNKKCEKYSVTIKKSLLEEEFFDYLRQVKPKDTFINLFTETVLLKYEQRKHSLKESYKESNKEIVHLEDEQQWYIDQSRKGLIPDSLLKKKLDELEQKITLTKMEQVETTEQQLDVETLVSYGKAFIQTIEIAWYDAIFEDKLKFQRMIFPNDVSYHYSGYSNHGLSLPFQVISDLESSLSTNVAPGGFRLVNS